MITYINNWDNSIHKVTESQWQLIKSSSIYRSGKYTIVETDDMVKLFTGPTFNKTGFVNMLIDKMGVKAYAVSDGVVLDRGKFNECPAAYMPVWAWLNREDINSSLHTVEVVRI